VGLSRRVDDSSSVVLIGLLPIATAILSSLGNKYPLAPTPRVISWMLTGLTVLLFYGLTPLLSWLGSHLPLTMSIALPGLCIAVTILNWAALRAFPVAQEDNRAAVAHLAARVGASDVVFVHGGLSEQFAYYERLMQWRPARTYLGNTGWPCCEKNRSLRVSDPQAQTQASDLQAAVAELHHGRLWVLLPNGRPEHWSSSMRRALARIPVILSAQGCLTESHADFDQIIVYSFKCP
jgi:hypothetical protein